MTDPVDPGQLPALPNVGGLVLADPAWPYLSGTLAGGGVAHLRVWDMAGGEPGHIAVVSDVGMGASVTNAAEHIWSHLVDEYGHPLWLLEHYPPNRTFPDDGDQLDQVTIEAGEPRWLRWWPLPPDHPDHERCVAWMRAHGFRMLAAAPPS